MIKDLKKAYNICLKLLPLCMSFMLFIGANTSGCWIKGQEKMPESAKRYRRF